MNNIKRPPPWRRPDGAKTLPQRRLLGDLAVCLGVLPAEALHASSRIHQPLLAGKERVANRADFYVNVALVGRTGLKVVSAGAKHPHRGIIRMNLFLGHRLIKTFPAIFLL